MTTIEFHGTVLEATGLTLEEVKLELAIRLFEQKRLSLHQAHLLAETQSAADFYALALQRTVAEFHGQPDRQRFLQLEALAVRLLDMMELVKHTARLYLASTFLRTPLASIMGFQRALANGAAGPVTKEQKELLNASFDSAKSLDRHLSLLADIVPYIWDENDLELSEVNLKTLIENIRSAMKYETKFQLEEDISAESPSLMVDEIKFDRVISCLKSMLLEIHPSAEGIVQMRANFQEPWAAITLFTTKGEELNTSTSPVIYVLRSIIELHGGSVAIKELNDKGWEILLKLPSKGHQ